jgi:hypothetical protein
LARELHQGFNWIRWIHHDLNLPNDPFTLEHPLSGPPKITKELIARADRPRRRDPSFGRKYLAPILETSSDFVTIGESAVQMVIQSNEPRAEWLIQS